MDYKFSNTSHQYEIYEKESLKSYTMPYPHYHNSYEIYILIKGKRNYIIGDELFEIKEMDVALIKPNTMHKTSGESYKRILIGFTDEYMQEYYTAKALKLLLSIFDNKIISLTPNYFNRIIYAYERLSTSTENEKQLFIGEILNILYLASKECVLNNKPTSENEIKIAQIVKYINENYLEITSLDEIAEHFFINKSHLCRIFKKSLNMSVITYLNNVKIQSACHLLLTTKKTVTDIGFECGFNSTMYFCKIFKKQVGISPLNYRKK